jgi:hypothetical protein
MKKLISILSGLALLAVVIVACKDNFNEGDFLKLQSQLKTQQDTSKLDQQIKQLNAAGSLLSFTVQTVEDGNPLSGVDVTVSNNVTTGSVKVTTDANGVATFPKASVGSNSITVSKSGYNTATAVIDFGSVTSGDYYEIVSGTSGQNIVPIKQSRSIVLPLFSTGGTGSTATITGKVTIENDITNTKPEIPQNITIKANFASGLASAISAPKAQVLYYGFNGAGIGSAVVDNTTGIYKMTVPATTDGLGMSLVIPEIDGTLKMAANYIDNQPANGQAAPQIFPAAMINQPTTWGPSSYYVSGYDQNTPQVVGAKFVFPTPPAPGAGLALSFSPVARPLSINKNNAGGTAPIVWDTYIYTTDVSDPTSFNNFGQTDFQVTNRGTGYTSSPTIAITGGGGSGAQMKASLRGVITGLSVTNGGAGYPNSGNVSVTLQFTDNTASPTTHNIFTLNNCAFTASGGVISNITLPQLGNNTHGLDKSNPWQSLENNYPIGFNVGSFSVVISGGGGTAATATVTVDSEVDHIKLEQAGSGYSSAPTIAFTGGGASAEATMQVTQFRTQWTVTPDNSGNTKAYAVGPQYIQWELDSYSIGQYTSSNVWDNFNISYNNYSDLLSVSGGKVIQKDPLLTFRTYDFSATKPVAMITPSISITQQASISINSADGSISSITIPSTSDPTFGRGYSSLIQGQIQPMFSGLPGTGAVVDLTNGNCLFCFGSFGEYSLNNAAYNNWPGPIYANNSSGYFVNVGSGYLPEVNQQRNISNNGVVPFSGNVNQFAIETGAVKVMDIQYGTGKRKNVVN